MPLRPIAVSVFIFIFIIIGIYETYIRLNGQHLTYQIDANQRWIGVVDFNADHGIDMAGVIKGDDSLLILDPTNPILIQILQDTTGLAPAEALNRFELADFDVNNDGFLNQQDPIFHYLRVLAFDANIDGYIIRSLRQAGIRGIKVSHIERQRKHQVILSDGTMRALYEINQPGGTSIYKSRAGTIVQDLP